MPLEELMESVERARRDAQLRYVVIYGAACSYCLGRAERLDGSYLRTFALELKEQLAQTLTAFVTSILAGPSRLDAERAEPPLRQIIDALQQVMCAHDAEKLAILRLVCLKSTRAVRQRASIRLTRFAASKLRPNCDAMLSQEYRVPPQQLCKNISKCHARVMEFTVIA